MLPAKRRDFDASATVPAGSRHGGGDSGDDASDSGTEDIALPAERQDISGATSSDEEAADGSDSAGTSTDISEWVKGCQHVKCMQTGAAISGISLQHDERCPCLDSRR